MTLALFKGKKTAALSACLKPDRIGHSLGPSSGPPARKTAAPPAPLLSKVFRTEIPKSSAPPPSPSPASPTPTHPSPPPRTQWQGRWSAPSRRCARPSPTCSTTPNPPPASWPTSSPAAPSTSVSNQPPHSPRLPPLPVRPSRAAAHGPNPPGLAEKSTAAFLQKLDRLTDAAGADLQRLESMAFGAVSFEELLGHCGEALSVYARHAEAIQSRLASFGYEPPEVEPEVDAEVEEGGVGLVATPAGKGCFSVSRSVLRSGRRRLDDDDDPIFGESLKSLGFSDACLATLSEGVPDYSEGPRKLHSNPESANEDQNVMKEADLIGPQNERNDQGNSLKGMIWASKE
ncbi:hypothetical protein U9M48_037547 [Paspalum notatum var. saurae]|uniref:Spindle and kinetochore-associated protein 3 n=1 Tax=Paspalum notatum var. saurae TaxID=547442 RepID=A0AAQ3XAR5_PASNO